MEVGDGFPVKIGYFRVFVNLQEGSPLGSHNLYPVCADKATSSAPFWDAQEAAPGSQFWAGAGRSQAEIPRAAGYRACGDRACDDGDDDDDDSSSYYYCYYYYCVCVFFFFKSIVIIYIYYILWSFH